MGSLEDGRWKGCECQILSSRWRYLEFEVGEGLCVVDDVALRLGFLGTWGLLLLDGRGRKHGICDFKFMRLRKLTCEGVCMVFAICVDGCGCAHGEPGCGECTIDCDLASIMQ